MCFWSVKMLVNQGQSLGILQRLGTGQSIEAFQHNLLEELRSVILWDHAIPTTPNLKIRCPSGLWNPNDIPCEVCKAWCLHVTETELMETGLLFMLNLKAQSTNEVPEISSLGVLLLRRDRPFDHLEIQALSPIHHALQILLEQSIALDWLINNNAEREPIVNLKPDDSEHLDFVDLGEGIESLSDPLFIKLGLTPRQSEVIQLLMKGYRTRTIAQSMGCSEATVRKHLENLYRRLGVQNRTAAIAYILEKIGIV